MIVVGIIVACFLVILGMRWRANKRQKAEEELRKIALEKKTEERIELGKSYKDRTSQMFISGENASCLGICSDDNILLYNQKGFKVEEILGCSLINEKWTEIEQENLGAKILKGAVVLALTGNSAFAAGTNKIKIVIHDNYGLRIVLKKQDKEEDIVFACGTDKETPQEAYKAVLSMLSTIECPRRIDSGGYDSAKTFDVKQAEQYYKDYRAAIYDEEIRMTQYRDWTPILNSLNLLSLDDEWIIEDIRQDKDYDSLLNLHAEAKKYGKLSQNEQHLSSDNYLIGTFDGSALIDNLFHHIRLAYSPASIWQAWLLFRTNRFVGLRSGCVDKELVFTFPSSEEAGNNPIVLLNEDNTFIIKHNQVTGNKAHQQVTATGKYDPLTRTVCFTDVKTEVTQGGIRTNKKGITAERYHGRWYGMMLCLGEMSGRNISEEITDKASEIVTMLKLSNEFPDDFKFVKQLIKLEESKGKDDTMTDEERQNDYILGSIEAKKVYLNGMNWKRLLSDKDI